MALSDQRAAEVLKYWEAQPSGVIHRPRLTPEELREVMCTRNDIPLSDFLVSVALVFVPPLALYLYPSVLVGILGALLNVHTFNRCAQIVHGSDHGSLCTSERLNVIIGQISGYFVGYLRQGHKETHDDHHRYLNSERDGDRMWCEPEAGVSSILRGWIRDLLLISATNRFLQYIPSRREKSQARGFEQKPSIAAFLNLCGKFIPVALVQLAVLLAYVAAAGFEIVPGIEYYAGMYLGSLFILYPAQIRLRANVEHTFVPGHRCLTPQDRQVVRSVEANWLERFIFAPLNTDYHCEHHILAQMPYYNAPKMRRLLQSRGFDTPAAKGYVSFIWHKWLAERALESRAEKA